MFYFYLFRKIVGDSGRANNFKSLRCNERMILCLTDCLFFFASLLSSSSRWWRAELALHFVISTVFGCLTFCQMAVAQTLSFFRLFSLSICFLVVHLKYSERSLSHRGSVRIAMLFCVRCNLICLIHNLFILLSCFELVGCCLGRTKNFCKRCSTQ